VVAVIIGGLDALNLIGDQLGLTDGGGFWGAIGTLNDNFGILGYVIVGIFRCGLGDLLCGLPDQPVR
jgi:high-affinity nickel-transport protein